MMQSDTQVDQFLVRVEISLLLQPSAAKLQMWCKILDAMSENLSSGVKKDDSSHDSG